MKYYIKIVLPLVIIASVLGFVLGLTYQFLEPKLQQAERNEELNALKKTLPLASFFNATNYDNINYYIAYDNNSNIIGYIFKTANSGYGGPVVCLISITNNALYNISIIDISKETPGLGTKANDPKWLSQFINITYDRIPRQKSDFQKYNLDCISGATLTSMAIAKNIYDAFKTYYKISSRREIGDIDISSSSTINNK